MDHSWINSRRTSDEYLKGVEEFLEFAQRNLPDSSNGRFFCPCVKCFNKRKCEIEQILEHLICQGIYKTYTRWIWHGDELSDMPSMSTQREEDDVYMEDDRLKDMIRDIGQKSFQRSHVYETLCSDADKPLYPRCPNFTRLSAMLKLVGVKVRNGWSDKSFTEFLVLLKDMLPKGNTLLNRTYEAKKVLCPMGMEYKKIHVCPNDCILYKGMYEGMHDCPKCGVSRYKVNDGNSGFDDEDVLTKGPLAKVLCIFQ